MMPAVQSFRDPAGCCVAFDNRILRLVNDEGLALLDPFLKSASGQRLAERQLLVKTRRLDDAEVQHLRKHPSWPQLNGATEWLKGVYEHERVSFPSFPYEWPPEMLAAAGHLTLELAQLVLEENYGLKDATPYNVLFQGPKPVFIDVLSFESRTPGDAVWKPYAQFVRTCLLPLLVHKYWEIPLADIFTTHRDGLTPQQVFPLCGPLQKWRPPFLSLVSLPACLARKGGQQGNYHPQPLGDPEKARFIVKNLFQRLGKSVEKLRPSVQADSAWTNYMESHSYSATAFSAKEAFAQQALQTCRPRQVLDVGANTGHFSMMAAQTGAAVVSVDADAQCMSALWRQAQSKNLNILPLVVDFARPSPAVGWRNRECPSFLQRATGKFDLVLMLAVLHHLLVTERVPLDEVLKLAAELTTQWVIIEFVGPGDAMFTQLLRGRDQLFTGVNREWFEEGCRPHFTIVQRRDLTEHRTIYLLKKPG